MDCVQCGSPSNYKCPTCRKPYCSVECCKLHKKVPCSLPPQPSVEPPTQSHKEYEFATEDTVPVEKLKLLENSEQLKECLSNPHVRKILEELDRSPHPDLLINDYMQEPIFTEFVDACLNVVQENIE